jgi:putative ABC transport system ATP-binding protein
MIELRAVTRSVRLPDDQMLHILRGVDLSVATGEHVAVVGRSGTGKSTLLNILGLLDAPSSGDYLLEGTSIARLPDRARTRRRGRDFGFVFQQFNLLPGRTALANVMAPLMYADGRQFWRRRALATQMLDRVGLGDRLDAMPERLSGGEQQRIAIARALVRGPRVILADEPTGALDVQTGQGVMDLLDEVAASTGAALVTITHDLSVAARAQRVYRLADGVLVPVELGARPADWVGDVPTVLGATLGAAPGRRRAAGPERQLGAAPELAASVPEEER